MQGGGKAGEAASDHRAIETVRAAQDRLVERRFR
jgi:hypothetical protein